jgi:hypothetical protein
MFKAKAAPEDDYLLKYKAKQEKLHEFIATLTERAAKWPLAPRPYNIDDPNGRIGDALKMELEGIVDQLKALEAP